LGFLQLNEEAGKVVLFGYYQIGRSLKTQGFRDSMSSIISKADGLWCLKTSTILSVFGLSQEGCTFVSTRVGFALSPYYRYLETAFAKNLVKVEAMLIYKGLLYSCDANCCWLFVLLKYFVF
jgi:hypothetical protein